ncbi:MAG: helix-turn-helix transcriptional regulator [Desulfofustis sp.]|nr:TetR/AcrR family transcriptional regulator [Desulfofustis sp.]NNK14522.1 helix-turn-helix transcriptional regulator [Desulfofustis sp.]
MNILIAPMHRRGKNGGPAPARNLCGSTFGVNPGEYGDSTRLLSLHDTSLPWEILETAHSLFQKKGFERTSIADICSRLEIKPFEFYNHFDSLDEVLEILWAR